jgi:hypothetical protein
MLQENRPKRWESGMIEAQRDRNKQRLPACKSLDCGQENPFFHADVSKQSGAEGIVEGPVD